MSAVRDQLAPPSSERSIKHRHSPFSSDAGASSAPSGSTICLGEDCRRYQRIEYSLSGEKLGTWPLSEQLLAALFEAGGIKKEEIRVKTIVTNA